MSASLKPPPPNARTLLRMHSEKTAESQLESNPLLKKNNMGHFFCIVCQVQIKTNAFWLAHAAKASHKQALLKFKEAKTGGSGPQLVKQLDTKASTNSMAVPQPIQPHPPASALSQGSSLVGYDDKEDDEEAIEIQTETKGMPPTELQPEASKDAQDQQALLLVPTQTVVEPKRIALSSIQSEEKEKTENALPKGFFDDQKTDYKMRGEKLPEEEFEDDWKEFNKDIATDLLIADIAQNQEDLVDQTKRNFELELQQFEHEQKVEEIKSKTCDLKKRLEQLRQTQRKNKREEIVTHEDALSESSLLDWRAKKIKSSS